LEAHVELHCAAVSEKAGECAFLGNGSSQARIVTSPHHQDTQNVSTVSLDEALAGRRVDILKIDVEGFEEMVLRGAHELLRSRSRPRTIFIEVHPYAWTSIGSGSFALLNLLNEVGYRVETLEGKTVSSIDRYGEIIARV